MHYVHNDKEIQRVCLVDQVFEVIWGALTRGDSEVRRHMISKRTVVRVFLDGHELDTVVSTRFDVGQNLVSKLSVSCYFTMDRRHADVRFVDFEVLRSFSRTRVLKLVIRLIVLGIEQICLFILNNKASPSGIFIHLKYSVTSLEHYYYLPKSRPGQ